LWLTIINPLNTKKRFLYVRYFITCIVLKKVNFQIHNHIFILLLLVVGFVSDLRAQKYEVGGGLGVSAYSGDIIRKLDPGQLGPQVTLFGKRNFDNVWTLRVGINVATLEGDDRKNPIDAVAIARDARFKVGMLEGSAIMEFNFLDYLRNDSEFNFSPYAFFGVGYTLFTGSGNTYAQNPVSDYSLGAVVIPFGGGVKYRLTDRLTLGLEAGFRPTMSDFVDKIDSTLPEIPRYQDAMNPNLPYGVNYGNPNDKDWYYFFGFNLSYLFSSTKCYAY
jgi:hypothetical protein